ncbi:unnamed protein product [marine sediment metagenome]|uniref:Uncharacterized protein n=1 Tax=marine sediment metagenome TaxID=412755 RepID=X1G0H2_9ZZZZ
MLLHKIPGLKNSHCESKSGCRRFASPQKLDANTQHSDPVLRSDFGPFIAYLLS